MSGIPPSVVCVVVTFNPDEGLLRAQTRQLSAQVSAIVWVDNHSSAPVGTWAAELGVAFVGLPENRGIACAQNMGVEWAKKLNPDAVLLMDHDSIPAPDMVAQLWRVMAVVPAVAAVGPHYEDPRGSSGSFTPFVQIKGLSMRHLHRQALADSVEVDHLIASGCLIRMGAWERVGPMSEQLFVDFVDVEWCLRARSLGWTVHGVWAALMSHTIGHEVVTRFGRKFRVHSPGRIYFHIRNGLVLYRQPWIPLNWKLVSAYRLLLKVGFYAVLGPDRGAYIRSVVCGVRDGLRLLLDGRTPTK